MNALPVGPEQVSNAESRSRYFEDLERWGFDVAYNAYYAHSYSDVTEKLGEAYSEFALEARRRGHPACVQIQSTVCAGDRVGIEEAQYDLQNNPVRCGDKRFFASFSSEAWREYLKELTTLFVKQYRYEWIVFEEPMYRVDIPGTKDRFYAKFIEKYPEVKYPESRDETREYLLVQQAKEDELVEFYSELAAHAKSVGAKKVGIMPWFFIPTIENTPEGTLNTSCNIGRLARIPDVDFLVVRMQPDNIYAGTMRTGDELEKSPKLYYIEVLAHALGKPVVAVSNPTDEHTDYPAYPLIPFEFYRDSVLAALAASPCGFTRHWYGQNYGKDDSHMEVLTKAAYAASRLGQPSAPVAFVYSSSGTNHAKPFTYETVFSHYWALAKQMAFNAHIPMLTFHAETLEKDLADHPEVRVLVFEEHFPLTVEQMRVIREWWQGPEKRSVIAFGAGVGFSANLDEPGEQPCAKSFPGVLELIGLKQEEEEFQFETGTALAIRDVSRVRRAAFLGNNGLGDIKKVANVRRVFGSRANILYDIENGDTRIPVVAEWEDRTTLAIFCGFGLSHETALAAERAIRYALREVDYGPIFVESCTEGILWNINKSGFFIAVNLSDTEGSATIRPGRARIWDCLEEQELPEGDTTIKVAPHSFRLLRVLGRKSKFYDIRGCLMLRKLVDGAGRADVEILAGRKTTFVLRKSPKEIIVDGKPSTIRQEIINGVYYVTLQQCNPGERKITLTW